MKKLSQESIILIVGILAVMVLIVIRMTPAKTAAISPDAPVADPNPAASAAPAYTSYNNVNSAVGYNFGPPVVNTLPAQTMGLVGAAFGCKSCG